MHSKLNQTYALPILNIIRQPKIQQNSSVDVYNVPTLGNLENIESCMKGP